MPSSLAVVDSHVITALQWLPETVPGADSYAPPAVRASKLFKSYKIQETADVLCATSTHKVALQFPDSLLPYSFFVSAALEEVLRESGREDAADFLVFVLGDTSYGECCVDEVAAQHLDADIVIHYGNACLSPTRNLPVFYVFPGRNVVPSEVSPVTSRDLLRKHVQQVRKLSGSARRVIILYDVEVVEQLYEAGIITNSAAGFSGVDSDIVVARPRCDTTGIVLPKLVAGSKPTERGSTQCRVNRELRDASDGIPNDSPNPPRKACTCDVHTREVGVEWSSAALDEGNSIECGPLVFPVRLWDDEARTNAGGENGSRIREESGSGDSLLCAASRLENTAFLWLSDRNDGEASAQLRNACLKLGGEAHAGFYWCSASETDVDAISELDVNRTLSRRYTVVDRARDAERIGIVAGTLGVAGNLAAIERCKRVIEHAGRRWYTMMVGKPTVTKLANFAEIDAFVLIACSESVLLDNRDYMQPVLTLFELEVALDVREWFGSGYWADFRDLLKTPLPHGIGDEATEADGTRQAQGEEGENDSAYVPPMTVSRRGDWSVSVAGSGGAAEYLNKRAWRGLDAAHDAEGRNVDSLETRAREGRSGVASGYAGEG